MSTLESLGNSEQSERHLDVTDDCAIAGQSKAMSSILILKNGKRPIYHVCCDSAENPSNAL